MEVVDSGGDIENSISGIIVIIFLDLLLDLDKSIVDIIYRGVVILLLWYEV